MSETPKVVTMSFRTNDVEELQEASSEWDQEYYRLSPGHFEGRVDLAQTGDRHVFREKWSHRIRYVGTAPSGGYGLALPFDQQAHGAWVGTPVCRETVVVQRPGQEADMISPDGWDALVLSVPEEELRSIVCALSDQEPAWIKNQSAVTLKPEVAETLRVFGKRLLSEANAAGPEDHALIARGSEQLVKLVLWALVDANENTHLATEPNQRARIVRRTTDLVLSDPNAMIGLTDICTHLGISLRSLHYAFQDVVGMSPATWLRRIRLNEVHKTLRRSSPNEIRIKGVAMKNGFDHAGHFGQQYKRLFGCSPSDTLHS